MVDRDDGMIRLAGFTEAVVPVGNASRSAAIEVLMTATKLEK
jgi:hypothetical protein